MNRNVLSRVCYCVIAGLLTVVSSSWAFPYTGWYEWGKTPELRYSKASDGTVHPHWFRLSKLNPYDLNKHFWIAWARSGERKYLEAATRGSRMIADNQVIHWPGGKDRKRIGYLASGEQHIGLYWKGPGTLYTMGNSEDNLIRLTLGYLLRDNRWFKDNIDLLDTAFASDFPSSVTADDVRWMGCTPDMALSMMMSVYRATQNTALEQKIHSLFDVLTDKNDPGGVDVEAWSVCAAKWSYSPSTYKLNRKALVFLEYHDLFDSQEAREIVELAAAMVQQEDIFGYQHYGPVIASRAFQWTKDAEMYQAVRRHVQGARLLFAAYEALPDSEKGVAHFRQTTGPAGKSWGGAIWSFPALKDPYGYLQYDSPTSAVPYLSLPVCLWALRE